MLQGLQYHDGTKNCSERLRDIPTADDFHSHEDIPKNPNDIQLHQVAAETNSLLDDPEEAGSPHCNPEMVSEEIPVESFPKDFTAVALALSSRGHYCMDTITPVFSSQNATTVDMSWS